MLGIVLYTLSLYCEGGRGQGFKVFGYYRSVGRQLGLLETLFLKTSKLVVHTNKAYLFSMVVFLLSCGVKCLVTY